jgi:hypothetical protein
MTFKKSVLIITTVLIAHAIGLLFGLYELIEWYDVPMHAGGGFAMGALGLAIWNEGIEEVRFKGALKRHLKWWLVPGIVLGFVALIGVLWELHEWLLDLVIPAAGSLRQPSLPDTMTDFVFDLLGGAAALLIWNKK